MKLEAISVCVNYGDFLAQTAKENRGLFSRWVVVTTPRDEETREVCRKFNLETVLTDDFTRSNPDEFAKARGINRGLEMLSGDAWRLHLDADVVLPSTLSHMLEGAHLHEDCIYGADRVLIKSWEQWQAFKHSGFLHHDYHYRVSIPTLPVGARWASPHYGYVPIGYFQLWHASADEWRGIKHRRYPERHNSAARCDVQFALQWDRRHRLLLPEVLVIHLESEAAKLGANWKGRKTKRFGPKHHHHHKPPKPYC